jgi:hypothetical protein
VLIRLRAQASARDTNPRWSRPTSAAARKSAESACRSLILRDDAGDKAAGVSGAEHLLADDSADFLLGTFNSSMVEVQSVVAEKHGVPYVAGGASTQSCTRGTCATSSDSRRR